MKVPELPVIPVDGFRIEYWTYEGADTWGPGLRRHLMIFVKSMTWQEFVAAPQFKAFHSYDPKNPGNGAPFDHEWIVLHQNSVTNPDSLYFSGRALGWDSPLSQIGRVGGVDSAEVRWSRLYATAEEALAAFVKDSEQFIARTRARLAEAEAAVATVKARHTVTIESVREREQALRDARVQS